MSDILNQLKETGMGILTGGATSAANDIIGMGLGRMMEHHNDQRQLKQQTKLQNLSIQGSKEMTDYQFAKQLQMWHDTNYSAQMAELAKAGLNPGLLYGMSGGGGVTTGGQAANVGEGKAEQNPNEVAQMTQGMGINPLIGAQMELLKAQANEANAKADATRGYQKDLATSQAGMYDSQGKLNIANTGKAEADTELTKVQTEQERVKLEISRATEPAQIAIAQAQLDKVNEETRALMNKNYITEQTASTIIKQVKWDLVKTIAEVALIKANTGKTQQETELLKKDNEKYFDKLASLMGLQSRQGYAAMQGSNANERNALTDMDEQAFNRWLHDMPDSEKEIADVIEKAMQAIILKQIVQPAKPTEVKGLHNRK